MGKRGSIGKSDKERRLGEPPKPRPDAPTCPSWLSKEAKHEWHRLAPELTRLGLLTKLDRTALAAFCSAYAWWKRAEDILASQGTVYVTPKGKIVARPEVAIAQMFRDQMKVFAAELGLTPTSRARMNVRDPDVIDPIDEMIRGSRSFR